MENTYKLIWSDEAITGLTEIIKYLEGKFSEKDIGKFAKKLDKQLEIIKKNPFVYSYSDKSKQVRRAIVAKLTSIYYKVEDYKISIVSIHDNRKNPDNIKY